MRTCLECTQLWGPSPTPAVFNAENSYPRPFPFLPPTPGHCRTVSHRTHCDLCLLTAPTASAFSCSLSEGSWSPVSKTRNWRTSAAINHLGAKSICSAFLPTQYTGSDSQNTSTLHLVLPRNLCFSTPLPRQLPEGNHHPHLPTKGIHPADQHTHRPFHMQTPLHLRFCPHEVSFTFKVLREALQSPAGGLRIKISLLIIISFYN